MDNKINIPIYRAKKIDSDEYVKGTGITDRFLEIKIMPKNYNDNKLWIFSNYQWIEIDPSTLSINFPDMKDADDKPIFASLSEDGRGGDILVNAKAYESFALTEILNFTAKYKNRCLEFCHKELKVVGIQK